jgi:hypothetical protein
MSGALYPYQEGLMIARSLAVGALVAGLALVVPAAAQQLTPDLQPRIGRFRMR